MPHDQSARPGDACQAPGCDGKMRVYSTRVNLVAEVRIRYLCCAKCGHAPQGNKWIVPLQYAPVRAAVHS